MSIIRSFRSSYILLMVNSLLLFSCQKADTEAPVLTADPATVQTWRYPCGPACDASAWVLVMQNGNAYEAPNLPPDLQKDDQPVSVQYRRTGRKSSFNPGTGLEIISIVAITPR
ncbi:MAG: hypothetical protein JNK20_19750 [Flavipsychrobacter sp.]|nr:hypothetical protein [Flavipsychrobacter sp.]